MKLKPEFIARMKELLGKDYFSFEEVLDKRYINSVRCNTLKISPNELVKRLEKKWKISQPYANYPEIITIDEELEPGEIGNAIEHILGYYYIQEISSMMPPLVLNPKAGEIVLDLAASPGSKTTQIASMMENKGVLIANDVNIGRIRILSANIQRCGVTNCIVTEHDGINLCSRLKEIAWHFDKILVDAPCSGEGTLRTNPKTAMMFNESLICKMSKLQKSLVKNAISVLKVGGELVYSTCTHGPEENEEIISYILDNFPMEIIEFKLPLKTREGVKSWDGVKFNLGVRLAKRVYPQDNNTEGFFIAKFRRVK